MGDVIVIAILGIIVALVIRSMWKNHKQGGGCSGCSCDCASCRAGCNAQTRKKQKHKKSGSSDKQNSRLILLHICVLFDCFKTFFAENML